MQLTENEKELLALIREHGETGLQITVETICHFLDELHIMQSTAQERR